MGTSPSRLGTFPLPLFVISIVMALAAGFLLRGYWAQDSHGESESAAVSEKATIWTCSMHPQVRQPDPGLCPICVMDLIPLDESSGMDDAPRQFSTSEAARALMQIQSVPVQRSFLTREISMFGRVDFDESRLAYITAWVPGRIERMFADYTGVQVAQGDHMVELFSPELIAAKQELQRAAATVDRLGPGSSDVLRSTAQSTLDAVSDRLKRWGMNESQIRAAQRDGAADDRITIYAPIGGTVIERNGREGMYMETGTQIYAIADMSQLWLLLEAYESDLNWLHYGQKVRFTVEALPGEEFEGRIAFIDPILNPESRSISIRVNVSNAEDRLKPGMFARARVEAEIATGSRVLNPELAGRWISPMHPEIIKDAPGSCDICGMALVPAEEFGYASVDVGEKDMPLIIPSTAPLVTGTRAVVYVVVPDAERPTFQGREVILGPKGKEGYIVLAGLSEGEEVVVHGNFKIDSALEIQAKPSMMNPDEEAIAMLEAQLDSLPPAFLTAWTSVFDGYLALNEALASDDFPAAQAEAAALEGLMEAVPATALEGPRAKQWLEEIAPALASAREILAATSEIEEMREALVALSAGMLPGLRFFPVIGTEELYVMNCPMAGGDGGADWIQRVEEMRNPYMGERMLVCGMTTERLAVSDMPEGGETEHVH